MICFVSRCPTSGLQKILNGNAMDHDSWSTTSRGFWRCPTSTTPSRSSQAENLDLIKWSIGRLLSGFSRSLLWSFVKSKNSGQISRLLYLGFAILLRVLPHTNKMFNDKIVNSHHFPDRFWTRLSRNSKILLKRTLSFPPENIIVKSSCISPFFPSHFLFIYSLRRCVCRCQIVLSLYSLTTGIGSDRAILFLSSGRLP